MSCLHSTAITLCCGVLILWLCFTVDYYDGLSNRKDKLYYKTALRRLKIAIGMQILLVIALVLIPTTRQMCAIKIVPALINNKQVKADIQEVYTLGMDCVNDKLRHGGKG